jgi:Protein of unknown function (DUF3187)
VTRRFAAIAPCLALAGTFLGASAAGQEAAAPDPQPAFGVRSMHILHVPLLDFGPPDPAPLAPGAVSFGVASAWATTYSTTWHARRYHDDPSLIGKPLSQAEADSIHAVYPQDQVLFADGELLRMAFTGRYGLLPWLSVSVEIPYIARGFGGMENFVQAFHRAFGIDPNGRNEFPTGRFTVMLQSPGGPMSLVDFVPESGIGDVTATVSLRRPRTASGWTFGADLAAKAPTGSASNMNGSGSWDGGGLVFAVWQIGRWTLEADASVVVPGQWKTPVPLEASTTLRGLVSTIYAFSASTRIGLSTTVAESPFRSARYESLSQTGVEGALGVEHDFGRRFSARLTITEQLPSAGDRADFGVVLGLRYR